MLGCVKGDPSWESSPVTGVFLSEGLLPLAPPMPRESTTLVNQQHFCEQTKSNQGAKRAAFSVSRERTSLLDSEHHRTANSCVLTARALAVAKTGGTSQPAASSARSPPHPSVLRPLQRCSQDTDAVTRSDTSR